MTIPTQADPVAGQRYLLLADISGYTAFLNGVERAHGVDFSSGLPAGYEVLGALLGAVVEGVQPAFDVAKLEGDAVFAVAPAEGLDGQGEAVLDRLWAVYRAFYLVREERKKSASDHLCAGCPVVGSLNLKMVLHRGQAVRQTVGSSPELLGPAVNVAHRLLKNSIQSRLGYRAYLFVTDAAAAGLGLTGIGVEHLEDYPDSGQVQGRVIEVGENSPEDVTKVLRVE
jgi:class 3 adenylate cyclase